MANFDVVHSFVINKIKGHLLPLFMNTIIK